MEEDDDYGVDINVGRVKTSTVNPAMAATIPSTIADNCKIDSSDELEWDWYEDDEGNRLPRVVGVNKE